MGFDSIKEPQVPDLVYTPDLLFYKNNITVATNINFNSTPLS